MIVLGIDPGTARMGYGLVSREGSRLRLVDYGCLETIDDRPLPARLLLIHDGLTDLIETHRPDAVGVERLLFRQVKIGARFNLRPSVFDDLGVPDEARPPGGDTWSLTANLGGSF